MFRCRCTITYWMKYGASTSFSIHIILGNGIWCRHYKLNSRTLSAVTRYGCGSYALRDAPIQRRLLYRICWFIECFISSPASSHCVYKRMLSHLSIRKTHVYQSTTNIVQFVCLFNVLCRRHQIQFNRMKENIAVPYYIRPTVYETCINIPQFIPMRFQEIFFDTTDLYVSSYSVCAPTH